MVAGFDHDSLGVPLSHTNPSTQTACPRVAVAHDLSPLRSRRLGQSSHTTDASQQQESKQTGATVDQDKASAEERKGWKAAA